MEFRSVDELGPPWSFPLMGDLRQLAVASRLLEGNPLNDPAVRPLWVYLPPPTRRCLRRVFRRSTSSRG